ncbi:ferritin family protein [Candidatus Omnitrophota bacterium]
MKIQEQGEQFVIVDFNERDAYKIACQIEKVGINFYRKLKQAVKTELIKEAVNLLLEEENRHLEFFEKNFARVSANQEDGFEEDDLLNYMDYGIFKPYQSIKDLQDHIDDAAKALRLGLIVEQKTVQFYQSCQEKVTSEQTKKELERIITEEKRHQAIFENALGTLNK